MSFSLKKIFAAETKEYDFSNGAKSAHVTTKKSLLSSSYTIQFKDASINLTAESTGSSFLQNCTDRGIKKAKDLCGIT
jgi:hypothetical protein